MLDIRQPAKPMNHDLGLDLQLRNLLRQRRDDVCEREPLRRLERVDGAQARRDIRVA